MKTSKTTRFVSLVLALAMVMNSFPFSAFAKDSEVIGDDVVTAVAGDNDDAGVSVQNTDGEISGKNTVDADDNVTDEYIANTNSADNESVSEPVSSYTVSIALPEDGVALAGGQSKDLLAQAVSAGSAMADVCLVSTYEDEPFDESYADAFNAQLFEGTGLTAGCDEDGIVTISGTPTANVAVNLEDAFAEEEPSTVTDATAVDTSAIYVSSAGDDTSGNGSEASPYATISQAYSAVANGGTIYLVSDLTEKDAITFGTDKTVTITSADPNNVKTIYSKVSFGYETRWFFNVNSGHVVFKNITIDGKDQKNTNGNYYAPGAVVASSATVTIDYGATIQNFKKNAGNSGGTAVVKSANAGAVVNIKDGATIKDCVLETGSADDPAAVLSSGTGAILYMTGGMVTGNTLSISQENTTAVVNIGKYSNPHFWMTGGEITGNTINSGAAAVYMRGEANACDIEFGDTAYVFDNYVNGTSGDQRNIYLKNDADGSENSNVYVKLCSALTGKAKLGVYAEKIGMGTKVAQGGGVSGVGTGSYTATAADTTYFVSDKATDAEILYCGGSEATCGLLQHDTNHNSTNPAIYLSVSPAVTATKNTANTNQIELSITRCTSDAIYVVLDKDMKPVAGKTLTGGSYVSGGNGAFTLTDSTTATSIGMAGLDKASGPYTVMLVGTGGLTVDSAGKASTDNLTDIATVNIVNFAGEGVLWSDGTTDFANGDYDIVTVPHNDQTGKATKSYTATTKTNYAFAETDAITGKLDNSDKSAATVTAAKDESAEKYNASVTVPAYGATNYNTVTLTGAAEKGDGKISIGLDKVEATDAGTLSESVKATLNITDTNSYALGTSPTYKYVVTNGRTTADGNEIAGDVTLLTSEDGNTAYSIDGLKYGDHVKVYVDGEESVSPAYFKVLNTALENGSFEDISTKSGDYNSQLKTGVDIAAWRTSANDQNIEVYPNPTTTYGVDKVPDGSYVAELNATEASSLYQEVSTTPGSTLGWTLEHTARGNAGAGTQKMAIVIGPTLDAGDTDPYKKSSASVNDMFMTIAAQIENPVAGETYYTTYNGKTYQVTIASDTKNGRNWKNYSGTYTVPSGQTETVFAFASLDTSGNNAKLGNLIDDVGFGTGVAITAATAAKNTSDTGKIDISIENSTKNGVYVVLDKDMKPVTGKTLSDGAYVDGGNGTFTLTSSDDDATTVSMAALDKASGPYTVMRVMSGTLSVGDDGKASTTNLTDIATVNVVNFAGDGVTWSDGTTDFENGSYDIVTVPHDDQTGKATKTYTATAKNGYALAAENPVTGKLDNDASTVVAVTATTNEDGSKACSVTVPAYGTTSKGTTNYNTVTLTGATTLNTGVKLLDKTDGTEMTVTDGVASKTYDGVAVAHTDGSVADATLNYTWQKKNAEGDGYTDIADNAAPSDAGEYNLKVTVTKTDATTELGTENLPFTIKPKTLTVTATAQNKTYDGSTTATLIDATLNDVLDADKENVTLVTSGVSAEFCDKNVGTGKPVTLTGSYTLSGTAAGNYVVTQPTGLTANITAKEVIISGLSATKAFDGDATAEKSEITGTPVIDNQVSGDNVSVDTANVAGTFNSANVGEATTVTLTGLSLAGDDAANYKLPATVTCTGTITKADGAGSVTLNGWTYGEAANAPQPASATNGTGNVTYKYKVKDADDGTYSGTVPSDAGDYTVEATFSATNNYNAVAATYDFTIAKRALTVTATANDKTYDGGATATLKSATLDGVLDADKENVTLDKNKVTVAFTDKNAGDSKAVTASVADGALSGDKAENYTISTATEANAKISPKTVTATITAENKTYNGSADATVSTPTLDGVIGSDSVAATATNAKFVDGSGVGNNKTVTASIALSGDDAGNYALKETTASATANITAKELGVTVSASSKPYDGTTDATATVTLAEESGIVAGDAVTLDDSQMKAAFDNAAVGNNKTVTVTGLTLTGDAAKNYKLPDNITATANINQSDKGIGTVTLDGWTYGETAKTPTATSETNPGSDGNPVTYQYKVRDAADDTYADAVPSDAGTYTVKATFPANDNYAETTATADFTIGPKALTVNVAADNKTYDGNTTATLKDAALDGVVEAEKDKVTLVTNGVSAAFGDKNVGTGKPVTLTGAYTLSGDAAKNYTLTQPTGLTASITAKEVSISGVAIETIKVYDGNTDAKITSNGTLNDVLEGDVVTIKAGTAAYGDKNVGENKAVTFSGFGLEGADAGNYALKGQPAAISAAITQREVTISGLSATKTYDGDNTADKAEITGTSVIDNQVNGDSVSVDTANMTGAFDSADAGENKTVTLSGLSLSGADKDNYKLPETVTCAGAITKADGTGSVKLDGWTYGDTANEPQPTSATNGTGNVAYRYKLKGADDNTYATAVPTNAGDYTVEATFSTTNNYNAVVATADFTIAKKTLTMTASAQDKTYDGNADATVNAALDTTGVVGTDDVALDTTGVTASFDAKDAGESKPVTVSGEYKLSGAAAGNYTLTQPSGLKANITKKSLTATITAKDKTYDGNTAATVAATLAGVVGNDDVTANVTNPAFADKNMGEGKTVTAAIALSGDAANNYTVNSEATTTASISAKEVGITGVTVEASKTYDKSTAAAITSNGAIDGKVETDDLTITAGAAAYEDANVGTGKAVSFTGFALQGDDASNYTLKGQPASTTASITAKELTVTATASDKTYDGKTEATVTEVTLSGKIDGDAVALNQDSMTASFEDANAGENKTVTVSGLSLDNNENGNYKLPGTVTATASITQAAGSGTVTLEGWTYGDEANAPTAKSTTNPGSDGSPVTYQYKVKDAADDTYTATAPADAGDYTVKATFPENGNYTAATATADFTISPKELTVNVTAANKEYDGTANATLNDATLVGVVDADLNSVTLETGGVTAEFDSKDAGTDKPVTLNGSYTLSGDASSNYTVTQPTGLKASITAAPLAINGATVTAKTYDGNDSVTITGVTFEGLKNGETLELDKDYTVDNAKYDGVNATGDGAATKVDFKVALADTDVAKNYSLAITAGTQEATIAKASHDNSMLTTKGTRGEANALDGVSAYVVAGGTVGEVATAGEDIFAETPAYDAATGKLTYTLKGSATESQTATVTLPVTSANYSDYNIVVTVGVTPKETAEIVITAGTYEYNGTAQAPTDITVTDNKVPVDTLEITYKSEDGTTYPESTTAPADAGKYVMTVRVPDSNNRYTGSATRAFEITKKALTATITAEDKTYDGNAAATVAPTLTGVVGNDDVTAVVANPVFEDKNVGEDKKVTASVSLSGDATGNYTVNATAETTATISAKEVSITGVAVAASKTYDKTTAAAITSNGAIDGKVETDSLAIVAGTASYDNANAGTGKAVSFTGFALEGDDASNYKLKEQPASTTANITAKEVSISGVAIETTKVYDGNADANITNDGTLTGVEDGDTVAVKAGTAAYGDKNVGENKAVTFSGFGLEGADAGNYTLKGQPADTAAAIAQREVTISGLSATKAFDGDATAEKSEISGVPVVGNKALDADDVSLDTKGMAGTFDSADVDKATTVTLAGLSLAGTDSANYKLPQTVTCAGTITKADGAGSVTLNGWTYGDAANAPQPASATNGTGNVTYKYKAKYADDATYKDAVPTNAGDYTVEATFSATNNYNAVVATADFAISPKELTVSVAAADKEYDGTANATLNDAALEGVVEADKDKVALVTSGVSAAFGDKNVGEGKSVTLAGSYSLSGDAAGNYTVAQPTGLTATISAKEVGITGVAVAASKTYDKTTAAAITSNGTIDGKVETDSLAIVAGTASYDNANAGTGKAVSFTGFALEGDDASNYKLKEQPASATADIAAKEVTASITAESKVFDGTTAAEATSTLTGVVAGDVVFAKITGAEFADANVADGKQVTAAIELVGDAAANYSVNKTATANASITAKSLTLTIKASDKKLDGSDAAVLDANNATLDGMVSGHFVWVGSAKGTFENYSTASDAASVNVTDVKLEGEDAGNYEIAKINSVTAKLIPLYVTFMDGDAKLDEKTISVYGTAPTDVVLPEKSGYNFAGWYTDEDCTAPWNSKAGVTADATVYAKWSTDALYTLSGVVKQGNAAKSDVSVTLYEGSAGIAATTTDANGMYSFGNVPNGTYTIAAKASDRAATMTVAVQDDDITQDIVLPATAVATEVQVAPGAPAATVSGIDEDLVNALIASDGNEVTAPKDGERLEVKLSVEADASDAEKAAIEKMENENTSWDFFTMEVDWSKYNLEGHIGSGNIADTVNVLAIRIPYDRDDKRDIAVYRHHMNGNAVEVTQLTQLQSEPAEGSYTDGTCYVGDDYIMLYTQKFSAFGIGHIADSTDPVISGAEDGKTYCGPVTLTITDEEIAQVTVNDKEVSLDADGRLMLNPADGKQTVVAVDAARNSSSITVTVNNGHTWGAWAPNGNGTHTRTCKLDATHTETAPCYGGTATCTDRAVCDDCGHEYGELDPGNHTSLIHVEAKEATTEAEGNIEHWYCEACDKYFSDAAGKHEISQADIVIAKKPEEPEDEKDDKAEPNKPEDEKDDGAETNKPEATAKPGSKSPATVPAAGDATAIAALPALLGTATVAAAFVSARKKRTK